MIGRKNTEESKRMQRLVKAASKRCFVNAMRVIQEVSEYRQADYVEGYAVIGGKICFEHAWVELADIIIDPTLPTEKLVYFPGLRYSGNLGISQALQIPKADDTEDLPILYRFGWGGINSPDFRAAMVAAYRFAGMEEVAQRYENWNSSLAVGA